MSRPQLAFKKTEDWEKSNLSDVLYEYNQKATKDSGLEHVSLTKEGVVPKTERYNRDFLVKTEDKNYRITNVDDICYNPANLKFGVICRNKYKRSIFSPIYVTFKVKDEFDPAFVEYLVSRNDFIKYALRYQEGTVYERMAVSPKDLLSIEIEYPSLETQRQIGDLFSTIDELIILKKKRLGKETKKKISILNKLVSKEIDSKCKEYDFCEIAELSKEKYTPAIEESKKCIELEHINQIKGSINGYTDSSRQSSTKSVFHVKEVLFGKLRPYLRKYYLADFDGVCSTEIWVLKPKKIILPEYLFYLVQSDSFISKTYITSGTKMPRADWKTISKAKFYLPELETQKTISSFLNLLDNNIDNLEKHITALEELKCGLSQKLFTNMKGGV